MRVYVCMYMTKWANFNLRHQANSAPNHTFFFEDILSMWCDVTRLSSGNSTLFFLANPATNLNLLNLHIWSGFFCLIIAKQSLKIIRTFEMSNAYLSLEILNDFLLLLFGFCLLKLVPINIKCSYKDSQVTKEYSWHEFSD